MIASQDNLFHVVAAEVLASGQAELYLVAGLEFEMLRPSQEVRRAIDVAKAVAQRGTASEALAVHFNTCVGAQTSTPSFVDGCGGFLTTNYVAVQFAVRKISDSPDTYRVLFARVDAGALAVDMKSHLDDLERRLVRLEGTK